ncbi:MAG: hypothetical protein PHD96_01300 [Candidatus Pacebacteria bacterium]|nr:hypothetical protein [Candidatus Paceibacterota bacterium]
MLEKPENKSFRNKELDFEAKQNWLGFWSLLLEIDQRVNPHLYKTAKNNENNRSPNSPNKA